MKNAVTKKPRKSTYVRTTLTREQKLAQKFKIYGITDNTFIRQNVNTLWYDLNILEYKTNTRLSVSFRDLQDALDVRNKILWKLFFGSLTMDYPVLVSYEKELWEWALNNRLIEPWQQHFRFCPDLTYTIDGCAIVCVDVKDYDNEKSMGIIKKALSQSMSTDPDLKPLVVARVARETFHVFSIQNGVTISSPDTLAFMTLLSGGMREIVE